MRYAPILLLLLLSITANAQKDWELKKSNEGIKVYIKDNPISNFKAFRGITILDFDMDEIHKVLTDYNHHPEIFPLNEESYLMEKKEGEYTVHYSKIDSPWPIDDRDGVYKTEYKFGEQKRLYKISSVKGFVPEKEDVVRIKESETQWELEVLPGEKVKIVYTVFAEPGGDIPSWLANSAIIDQPYDTLIALKKRLQSEAK
jgi:hypothetical protein